MRKISFLILFCFTFFKLSSAKIKSDYVALYELNFVTNDKNNTTGKEQFILLMDKKNNQSCFLSTTVYAMDSLLKVDQQKYLSYDSSYPEIVVSENGKFDVYEQIIDFKYRYSEPNTLKWEILKETKTIGTYKAQLAQCKAYGRIWYAWFSSDVPLNFGPYKFNGLPGFIVMLYDADKKLTFKLTGFKKGVKQYELPNPKEYKMVSKSKFYKVRYKILTTNDCNVIFSNAEERKRFLDAGKGLYKCVNRLDIEYPDDDKK